MRHLNPSPTVVPINPHALPDIPGLECFEGRIIHSAAWDHDGALEGRQAAVIGDVATVVRLLPAIAPRLRHLTVFQQVPAWVAPQPGPVLAAALRRFGTIPQSLRGSWQNHAMAEICKWHLRAQIPNAGLRSRLTPDHRCGRPVLSNDYYPVFNRRNVMLVTEAIARIRPGSIETTLQRRHPVDILIIAPGYAASPTGAEAPAADAALSRPHQTGFQTGST